MKLSAVTLLCAGLLASALTGCATQPAGPSLAKVSTDKFSDVVTVNGVYLFDNPFGGISKKWYLRSWVDKKTQAVTHQLYGWFTYIDSSWKFYQSAADDTAQSLEFTSIDRQVTSCSATTGCIYTETFGLAIPDSRLQAAVATGFQVKISSKSGEWVVLTVAPEQIQKQLDGIKQAKELITGPTAPKS